MKIYLHLILLSLFFIFSPIEASAENKTLSIEEIQAKLEKLTSQVQELSSLVEKQNKIIEQQAVELKTQKVEAIEKIETEVNQKIQNHVEQVRASKVHNGNEDVIRITKDPTPKFETADGRFSFQPFGRVHLDATVFNNDKSDNENNTNIRRGRFGFKGKIGENLEYQSEMDFSEDEADIQDMTLSYTGLEMLDVTIGHHRPPVGFERNTSSNHNMLIERAVPTNLFSANRKIGASASTKAQDYFIGFGVFNEDAGSNSNNNRGEDLSFDSRIAGNLFGLFDIDEDDILHVGLGHSYQKPSDEVRYRARPGIGDGSRFIDTGIINDVDTINVVNAELVTVFDSLSFQGEYFNTAVDRKSTNANFSGYYAQMGYFLTGEKRNYNRSSGLFSRTNVLEDFSMEKGGYGAWELLARFDSTDLSDASAGILGGELDLYTLGLNWYLNKNVRLMSNIIVVDSDENAATLPNDDPTIFKLRAQWDF